MIEYALLVKKRGRNLEEELNRAAKRGWVFKGTLGKDTIILARKVKKEYYG